ncbi:MAG: sulfotransferase, partial [Planctomycetota bacterium]
MEADRPIFIVGPHRSGTTLLYRKLAMHPDVGYYNRADRRCPWSPLLARMLTRAGFGSHTTCPWRP